MSNNNSAITSGMSRVWFLEGGASPFVDPSYMGLMKVNDPSWPQGDITSIRKPDPNKFGKFKEIGQVRGQRGRVATGVTGRYPEQMSDLLRLARLGCRVDMQVHIGACKRGANPQDYLAGWAKILVFPDAEITTYSQGGVGALADDENNPFNEMADISAEEMYEIVPMSFGQQGSTVTVREIKSIDVCDTADCGDCDEQSDGCQRVFATMIGVGATPGTNPSVLFSEDGGSTWDASAISTLFSNEDPSDSECIGTYFVIISNTTDSLHYASTDDILDGSASWQEVNTGFVGAGSPNAIVAIDPRHIWVVGDAGYVYFASNILSGVSVQDAGVATSQNLLDVAAFDANNIVAVGAANAVINTENGGSTWLAVTGPAVGVSLAAIWMLSQNHWLVGTADGRLFSTRNSGQTWTQVGLPASITQIDDIKFVDDVVGFIAARTATSGTLLRTTDGGRDWYVLPESGVALPAADYFHQIALCSDVHNTLYAGGLDGGGTLGMIVKGEGA